MFWKVNNIPKNSSLSKHHDSLINPLQSSEAFLYPLKTSENVKIF